MAAADSKYSMLQVHRTVLQDNHVALLHQLVVDPVLLGHLQATNTITPFMKQDIEAEKTKANRATVLLDLLPRRGPHAMKNFIKALIETDQEFLAESLDEELTNKIRATLPSRPMPTGVQPEAAGDGPVIQPAPSHAVQPSSECQPLTEPAPVIQYSMTTTPYIPINLQRVIEADVFSAGKDVYSMTRNPRGHAIIINNEDFLGVKGDRAGSELDETNIDQLLNGLHFRTNIHTNLTAEEIKTVLKTHSEEKDLLEKSDAFILVIMGHGTRESVYGIDGRTVNIQKDIVDVFEGTNCPALITKPKVFIIQACQGDNATIGVVAKADGPGKNVEVSDAVPGENEEVSDAVPGAPDSQIIDNMEKLKLGDEGKPVDVVLHEKSDILIAYSTVQGYFSWRHPKLGSWFIRILVETVCEEAHKKHFLDILTGVARKVNSMETETIGAGCRQISETRSTFTRDLYFFHGYFKPSN